MNLELSTTCSLLESVVIVWSMRDKDIQGKGQETGNLVLWTTLTLWLKFMHVDFIAELI